MWITAAEVVGDAFFGIAVIADQTLIGEAHYHAVGYPYGPSLATAQVIGGGIIWILGDFVGLPFLAVQLIQMMRADKQEAAEIDAVLDARDAERAAARAEREALPDGATPATGPGAADGAPAAVAAGSVTGEPQDTGEAERPWWETDRRITDRFKQA
jgi:hypothetical protein